jgi:hypothetical protein
MSTINYAKDQNTNQYVTIHDAIKNNQYLCLCCQLPLIVKQGDIKSKHFSHKVDDKKCHLMNYNTLNDLEKHKLAQQLLQAYLLSGGILNIKYECHNCFTALGKNIKIDNHFNRVELEYPVQNGVGDVVLLNNNQIVMIIEVYNTHKTTKGRKEEWYEFKADYIIQQLQNVVKILDLEDVSNQHFFCIKQCITFKQLGENLGCYENIMTKSEEINSSCRKSEHEKVVGEWYLLDNLNHIKNNDDLRYQYNKFLKSKRCLCCRNKDSHIKWGIHFCKNCYYDMYNDGSIKEYQIIKPNLELREKYRYLTNIPKSDTKYNTCLYCEKESKLIWFYGYRYICCDCINTYDDIIQLLINKYK